MKNKTIEEYENSKKDLIRQQRVDILALKRLKIFSEEGEQIYFSSLWKDRTVVVIFLRHFSCIGCRAHADQIWNLHRQMKNLKMKIIFIGNGNPNIIKVFKEDLNLHDAEIYTDPSLETFKACGMHRSVSNYINLKSFIELRKLRKKGYTQGKYTEEVGDILQNGGVVGFRDPGKVVYHFTSKHLGDYDDPDEWPRED
ncbi:AhpC/TSA family protein [Halobacteriovorax sp. JY17]|uniref:AhpC/TSA family protein n=1 Tax=Halobacteriovorax sp. JY17 TaxID=2014617 RepID=UPI000C5D2EAD|nr:AhpC/TSA family protein [Halobacteriovorax sp. JY17]PIK13579.1 MAG: hypothetical protein CES88_15425 [Halobacteriovorax sp. JY17]